jgi:hypothetical protein
MKPTMHAGSTAYVYMVRLARRYRGREPTVHGSLPTYAQPTGQLHCRPSRRMVKIQHRLHSFRTGAPSAVSSHTSASPDPPRPPPPAGPLLPAPYPPTPAPYWSHVSRFELPPGPLATCRTVSPSPARSLQSVHLTPNSIWKYRPPARVTSNSILVSRAAPPGPHRSSPPTARPG